MADSKKYLDSNGLLYFWQKIKAQLGNKVDKVEGKGLSTNDYTTDEMTKLAGIATGANKTVVDSTLSDTSSNPVQNSTVKAALDGKAAKVHAHDAATTSTSGFMSADDKKKLDGIATGATKITVDTALSATSTNPVQNKIINTALDGKAAKATTLAGYGITDAYTQTQVDTAVNAKAAKATSLSGYGITDAYTKTEIDNKLTSAMRYKGEVETYGNLPTTGNVTGDVWNVATEDTAHGVKAGDNVAWNGTTWDVLSGLMDLSSYLKADSIVTNTDIDTIVNQ